MLSQLSYQGTEALNWIRTGNNQPSAGPVAGRSYTNIPAATLAEGRDRNPLEGDAIRRPRRIVVAVVRWSGIAAALTLRPTGRPLRTFPSPALFLRAHLGLAGAAKTTSGQTTNATQTKTKIEPTTRVCVCDQCLAAVARRRVTIALATRRGIQIKTHRWPRVESIDSGISLFLTDLARDTTTRVARAGGRDVRDASRSRSG